MNTGGRRRPLGPLAGGLAGCALVVVVLSLWLGAGSAFSPTSTQKITTISQTVAVAPFAARSVPSDQNATAVVPPALVIAVGLVLVLPRRAVPHQPPRDRRPSGCAPPGPLAHY